MEACDVSLPQPIEYIDTICLDKGVILADGCGTATLTTEAGEALPVTFIVSQHVLENSNGDESIKEIVAVNDGDIIAETPADTLDVENASVSLADEARTVYTIHFPSDSKEQSSECLELPENGTNSEDKSMTSDNSVDNEFLEQSDLEELQSVTNLEDFMDVVTTYRCKFCRFTCHWKSGLVSHIRCCHIAEKKCIVTLRAEKEPNIVTARREDKNQESLLEQTTDYKIEDVFSISSAKHLETDLQQDSKFSKSPESETDSEQSSKNNTPILERHIFLCGQCSDGFMTLEDCKQHMIDDHDIKLEQDMIKPLRKRGRPRTRPYNDNVLDDGLESNSKTKETKRMSRPPKNLEDDYDFGLKRKPKRENLSEKMARCTHNGCGHRFSSTSNLHYHLHCHAPVGKSFICPECRSGFEHWRGVVMHLWKEHSVDVDLHSCSECNYKTYSFFKLDNHKKNTQ